MDQPMRQNSKFIGALKKFGMLLVNMNTSNQKQSNLGNTYVFLNRNHLIKIVDYILKSESFQFS